MRCIRELVTPAVSMVRARQHLAITVVYRDSHGFSRGSVNRIPPLPSGGSFVLSNVRESDKMQLQVEYVDISTIKPYKGNAKEHPKEQIEQIKKSMQEFGVKDPIGIWHNEIVEGHGRYLALKELGEKQVPVIRLDDLTDEQRRAYTLVHNQLTMNSGFDLDTLKVELDNIGEIDMSEFGFNLDGIGEEPQVLHDGTFPEIC